MTITYDNSIAIVAMTCRAPGAASVPELWDNLRRGVESIERWGASDDARLGVTPAAAQRWVRARAFAPELERFDAQFFGYSPVEAALLDPQQRMFLECCWEALERAGHIVPRKDRLVAVYGGAALSSYLLWHVAPYALAQGLDPLQVNLGNAESFLTTRVSYKLDLRGPSHSVTSACSTSLVAVHLACQSLLAGECDVALAGGVSLNLSLRDGYQFIEGSVLSPDGSCRPFDADAQGIVFGSGAGVVVLRRLADALADGDPIHAVILGSATNNDGGNRAGYTAPSIEGQTEVIAEALANAGVDGGEVTYVEAHGTGTRLGDPIELRALGRALGPSDEREVCAVGSIKSNLGHLDAAAGVLGLIKAALMVEHGELVPSLGCATPNPAIDWDGQGFRVQRELAPWPADRPRVAGVSAFGMGGSNAHVVLAAPPARPALAAAAPGPTLLVLSAKSQPALRLLTEQTADALGEHELAQVAYTLACRRRRFEHRLAVVVDDRARAAAALRDPAAAARVEARTERPVVLMFPGQGSQYPQMGARLYHSEPAFRAAFDRCAAGLARHLDVPLADLVLAPPSPAIDAAARLAQTRYAQPALFAVEYALAELWRSIGVVPAAMIGHSVGELVAATLAGVFSLEDALALVAARGALMDDMRPGKMLSVSLPASELEPWLGERVELAAVNGPELCVVGGADEAIAALASELAARNVSHRVLHTSHAFHTRSMEAAARAFAAKVAAVERRAPTVPYASNVTGKRITAAQATDPAYWGEQMRRAVQFSEGLAEVGAELDAIYVEVGPGRALATFARVAGRQAVVQSLPEANAAATEHSAWLRAVGELWLAGAALELGGLGQLSVARRVVELPTHPQQRQRHWIERAGASLAVGRVSEATVEGQPTAAVEAASPHARPSLSTPYAAPVTEDERRICAVWQQVLGVGPIGIDDDFFDLGGHSLLATTIVGKLRELYQLEVPLQRLFEAPTVRSTARILGDEQAAKAALGDDSEKAELLRLLAEMSEEEVERELGSPEPRRAS